MLSEQAFIAALREFEGLIHKVCIMYEQEESQRQDLFQEIVLNAWKGISSFRGDARFSTWLYRVAINTAISFFRKSQKEIRIKQYLPEYTPPLPEHEAESSYQALYSAIGELSKVEKALVMLYLDEYSYAEMATLLGISENHVAVKMSRIRKRLKIMISTRNICE